MPVARWIVPSGFFVCAKTLNFPKTHFLTTHIQKMMKKLYVIGFLLLCNLLIAQDADVKLNSGLFSGLRLRNIGPALMSGRIADIAKVPSNPSTWYVAVASGGVWKTTNNATTWEPIFDDYDAYTTGALAIDPQNPGVIWLGTGENASQRSAGYGDGVYKSLDGGLSWTNVGLKKSEHIGKILIDPRNSDVVYVASQGPLWAPGGDRGLFKTTDGGKTWKNVLNISENTGITDIAFDPRNPDIIFAASYQRRRHVGILVAGGPESAIYKTTDGGENWKKLTRGIPGGDKGRIALAVSPQQPDIVYALIAAEGEQSGFFRSDNQGESWSKQSDYIVVDLQYYGEIYADPHHFDRVYAVDVLIHVTDDGGKNFRRLNTRNKHVDNHSILFDPQDPDYLLVGCDGGIYETWDQGNSWKYVSNLPICQFYRVGIDNAEPFYNVYGGTQDNSTLGGPSRTTNIHGIRNEDWFVTVGGDGFQTRVDPENPDILYSMSQYAGIVRYDKRSGERVDIQPQPEPGEDALRWYWDAPLIISPHAPQRLYFAAQRLYRSDDRGNSWTPISEDLSRGMDRNQRPVMGRVWSPEAVWKNVFTSPFGTIVSLSESRLKEGLICVGTDDGLIQITEDGGKTWRKIDKFPGIPDMTYISDVFLSQHEPNTIYALFNNHKEGDFKPYALKSTDLGRTWTSIAKTLPERHITWTIVEDHVDKNLLFLGTEFGLFFSNNGGNSWIQLKGNVPTVAVRDLEIQERENDLVVATFGRGFLIFDDYSPLRNTTAAALSKEAILYPVKNTWMYHPASIIGGEKGSQGDSYFTAPNPPHGAVFTYYLKESYPSLKQERKSEERAALRAGKDVTFPDWETLKKEDLSEAPVVILMVKDSDGNLVQTLRGANRGGFHRVSWDLGLAGIGGRRGGPMVLPGTYSVTLYKMIDGKLTQLSEKQLFELKPLGLATLPAQDMTTKLHFLKDAGKLQQTVSNTLDYVENQLQNLGEIKRTVMNSAAMDGEIVQQIRALELKLQEARLAIVGDETRSNRAEFVAPSLLGRIRDALGSSNNSSPVTETHRRSVEIAKSEFANTYQQVKQIQENELAKLHEWLKAHDLIWASGGTLPQWQR